MLKNLAKFRPPLSIPKILSPFLGRFQQRLPKVRPWVAIVLLLGVGLLGYYSTLGMRYWKSSDQVTDLTNQIRQLSRTERQKLPESGALTTSADSLDQLRGLFSYPSTDDLIAILTSTAKETQVDLGSVVVGDPQAKTRGELKYQTQPISITIQGQSTDIYRFFSRLYETVPVAALSRINIANLERNPVAQAQVLFYLSPEAIQEKERAK